MLSLKGGPGIFGPSQQIELILHLFYLWFSDSTYLPHAEPSPPVFIVNNTPTKNLEFCIYGTQMTLFPKQGFVQKSGFALSHLEREQQTSYSNFPKMGGKRALFR